MKIAKSFFVVLLGCVAVIANKPVQAQSDVLTVDLNTITTAVPFLIINPETRGGGMGDIGVATSPDANSIHWNASKLAFAEKDMGVAISYTPWLRQLVPDINLSYLSGYKKIGKNARDQQVIGVSLLYFTLGQIQFTDETGQEIRQFRPSEFALDVAYARKLSDRLSGGIALRYIHSNLTGGTNVQGADSKPGRSVAADISAYYENDDFEIGGKDAVLAFGANISNIGAKISYTETTKRDFLPINLRLGPRLTVELDEYNSISIAADFNKLLVPTPPVYARDSNNQPIVGPNGEFEILSGKDPDRAVASGIFGSFTDAPGTIITDDQGAPTGEIEGGSVLKEELREINFGVGAEYWYDKQFAVRAGYFWEHISKGNRKFVTLGAGIRYNVFGLDFAYLIPAYFGGNQLVQNSPLQNTLRFTLTFDFDAFKSQGGDEPAVE